MLSRTSHRSWAALAIVVVLLATAYWLVIFTGTHLPASSLPRTSLLLYDKLLHCGAYCGLAVVLLSVATAFRTSRGWKYVGVFLVGATYGVIDEVTQQFVPNRSADARDWLADVVGLLLGCVLFAILEAIFRRLRRAPAT